MGFIEAPSKHLVNLTNIKMILIIVSKEPRNGHIVVNIFYYRLTGKRQTSSKTTMREALKIRAVAWSTTDSGHWFVFYEALLMIE
jgi:hypothetical protein